jgi:hypothetical protein
MRVANGDQDPPKGAAAMPAQNGFCESSRVIEPEFDAAGGGPLRFPQSTTEARSTRWLDEFMSADTAEIPRPRDSADPVRPDASTTPRPPSL